MDETTAQSIEALFAALPSDEARTDVLARLAELFCPHCGGKQPDDHRCQCWNDE